MSYHALIFLLLGCLSIAACTDTAEPEAGAAVDPQADAVSEGGPETDATETPHEAAVPEWEERDGAEVADGDQ